MCLDLSAAEGADQLPHPILPLLCTHPRLARLTPLLPSIQPLSDPQCVRPHLSPTQALLSVGREMLAEPRSDELVELIGRPWGSAIYAQSPIEVPILHAESMSTDRMAVCIDRDTLGITTTMQAGITVIGMVGIPVLGFGAEVVWERVGCYHRPTRTIGIPTIRPL